MASPVKKIARYEDVLNAPPHPVAELIRGTLQLGNELAPPFDGGKGGPGGWGSFPRPRVLSLVGLVLLSSCVRTIGAVWPQPTLLMPSGPIALRIGKGIGNQQDVEGSNYRIVDLHTSLQAGFDSAFGGMAVSNTARGNAAPEYVLEIQKLVFREDMFPFIGYTLVLKTQMVLYGRDGKPVGQCAGTLKPGTPGMTEDELKDILERALESCAAEFFKTNAPGAAPPRPKDTSEL